MGSLIVGDLLLEHELNTLIEHHDKGEMYLCDLVSLSILYDIGDLLEIGNSFDSPSVVSIKEGCYDEVVLYRDLMFEF